MIKKMVVVVCVISMAVMLCSCGKVSTLKVSELESRNDKLSLEKKDGIYVDDNFKPYLLGCNSKVEVYSNSEGYIEKIVMDAI